MTSFVMIDASFTFKLLTPNPLREQLKKLVRQWVGEEYVLCTPHLWLYEMTSILTKMVYFGEMDEEDAYESLGLVLNLGVQMIPPDEDQVQRAFVWTRRLDRVAAYDSFYLAVAESLDCEFWTADRRLVNAVKQPWVRLAG
jgi:predicted nucleic acid-binding protein